MIATDEHGQRRFRIEVSFSSLYCLSADAYPKNKAHFSIYCLAKQRASEVAHSAACKTSDGVTFLCIVVSQTIDIHRRRRLQRVS